MVEIRHNSPVGQLRRRLEQEKGRLEQVRSGITGITQTIGMLQARGLDIEQAAVIHRTVAQQTQERLQWYINDMVSTAIDAIFPDDNYRFKLEFVQRRGKTEADIFLEDHTGNRIKPSDGEGGGLILVTSFALRIALWSLSKSSRPVFMLDEPAHFIHSRNLHSRFAELLRGLSDELGVQIIMVTGEDESEEIISGADKVFRVMKGKIITKEEG